MSTDIDETLCAISGSAVFFRLSTMKQRAVHLRSYSLRGFSPGVSALKYGLWVVVSALIVSTWIPGSALRRIILRRFGAKIGRRVVIKPRVRIKFPWRLSVADDCWIGEGVWIDNLAPVTIEQNACLSQAAYLCTGSHDWSSPEFSLLVKPITIGRCAWIGAHACVGPGVIVGEGAVLTLGSIATYDLVRWTIYRGNPAGIVRARYLTNESPR